MAEPSAAAAPSVAPARAPAMLSRSKRWLHWLSALVGIGLSGLFPYLAGHKADVAEIRLILARADLGWLAPMVLVSLVDFWLRAGLGCSQPAPGRR